MSTCKDITSITGKATPEQFTDFYAGIVLYHPENLHHLELIRTLLTCNINVIVFDNSEDIETKASNKDNIANVTNDQLRYLEAKEGNIGLSSAYNRIVREVLKNKSAKGLFLFDQDADVNTDALTYLISSFNLLQNHSKLGVLCGYALRENGIPYRVRPRPSYPSLNPSLIAINVTSSSFSLIPITTFMQVGNFQDDFFIDYIDCDFCFRCWQQDLPVFVDTRATFTHRVGLGDVYILNKPLFPIATPFRHYYQARNTILSQTRANLPVFKIIKDIFLRILIVFVIGIYTRSLIVRLKYTARGIIDGIKGKAGRFIQ